MFSQSKHTLMNNNAKACSSTKILRVIGDSCRVSVQANSWAWSTSAPTVFTFLLRWGKMIRFLADIYQDTYSIRPMKIMPKAAISIGRWFHNFHGDRSQFACKKTTQEKTRILANHMGSAREWAALSGRGERPANNGPLSVILLSVHESRNYIRRKQLPLESEPMNIYKGGCRGSLGSLRRNNNRNSRTSCGQKQKVEGNERVAECCYQSTFR